MSLHGKVVAWFVFFASLTVILFVLGDYYQSTRALRVALESRATALATTASAEIDRRYDRAEADLRLLAVRVADPDDYPDSLTQFAHVRIFRNDSLIWESRRSAESVASGCAFGDVPFNIRFADPAHHRYRAEATMTAGNFLSEISALTARLGRTGVTSVLETGSGSL